MRVDDNSIREWAVSVSDTGGFVQGDGCSIRFLVTLESFCSKNPVILLIDRYCSIPNNFFIAQCRKMACFYLDSE